MASNGSVPRAREKKKGEKERKRKKKGQGQRLRNQNFRIPFQQVRHGILDRLSSVLVILDAQNLSRVLRLESRVCHSLRSRPAQSTRKTLLDLGHRLCKMCNDLMPKHVPGEEEHTLSARRVEPAGA